MTLFKQVLAVLLSSTMASAAGNTFTKVRYNGGSVASSVDPRYWGNQLTVTPDRITLEVKGTKKGWDTIQIIPKSVTSLSYGQEAHRRVGTMVALAILVAPVALFGLLHKTRLHFIGIQYITADGKSGGILLQGDKENYRAMLVALQGVSNVPVSVSDKDREFVPVGITAAVTPTDAKPTPMTAALPPPSQANEDLVDTANTATPALTNASIIRMVQAGVSQGDIIRAIAESSTVQFNFMYLDYLTNSGVSEEIVRAMTARAYGRPIPGYKPAPKSALAKSVPPKYN
ncbi:MAG TPA: hypothetical protein VHW09_11595 [Bryobacteraceae bacterium]|jgi:hypothetical protein|nr:hypothetical protein [Bryobacteraceae bacterium]